MEETVYRWLASWGFGHRTPQLVLADVIQVDEEEQRALAEYYEASLRKLRPQDR